jgi:putative selenate reductase
MSDKFSIIPFRELFKLIINQLDTRRFYFGIPEEMFFKPDDDPFRINRFGTTLESPLGVAAGPHTQMAQNIIAAWLCGARYIELKTIQTLNEIKVSKPCIDMQDEGYNCEWSQELKIQESFDQYLNAWILLHILKDKFGYSAVDGPGTIFNMSVGYDLKGIKQENVQWFFSRMTDCSIEKTIKIKEIEDIYPRINEISIPDQISHNVTLSTMHGCPPDEIEKIGLYLLEEKKLHTIIKLNPTLLGKQKLNEIILNSGFNTTVPDIAFEHDLKYPDAIKIINSLQNSAARAGLHFGLKLSNTLESLNNKKIFSAEEKTMYMSGRALHPVAINLAARLQSDFDGALNISFSAGVNAFNFSKVIQCGLSPVTVCSDILKPGGYGLLKQYLQNLKMEIEAAGSNSISGFIGKTGSEGSEKIMALANLKVYAEDVLYDKDYKMLELHQPDIKTERKLGIFDCIKAPCTETCPTNQDIPDYLYYTAKGDFSNAFKVIMRTNPFPNTTGMICDHLCQSKCTRINYDSSLLIREIKRFVSENHEDNHENNEPVRNNLRVAIIGGGPSGLSCAYFLARAGFLVEVFEMKNQPGGMVSGAIPSFRITSKAFRKDVARIESLGVKIHYEDRIDREKFERIKHEFHYIYISTGAQTARMPEITNINSKGVIDPLQFLFNAKNGRKTAPGKNVAIIGGGNTAMDVARTAWRLVGKEGKVTIIYRRTIKEMPADIGEIKAVINEGIEIIELVLPIKINTENNSVKSMTCVRMKLDEKDFSGRPEPIEVEGSKFDIEFDCIIPAIGQDLAIDFIDIETLDSQPGIYETKTPNIFIGGDALRGASTAINAIGDGRKAAQKIIEKAKIDFQISLLHERQKQDYRSHMAKRMFKNKAVMQNERSIADRRNFNLVTFPLAENDAIKEASRCLACDEVCNICVTVCPNLAIFSYTIEPKKLMLEKVIIKDGKRNIVPDQNFNIIQSLQILHIADWCNECGNCTTFCPTSGTPYLNKPHLYLQKESFETNDDGYYFDFENSALLLKEPDSSHSLIIHQNEYIYKKNNSFLRIDKENFTITDFELNSDINEFGLNKAVEMKYILEGVLEFYNFNK